jgi:2-desacetyl-2-hydroxyethyl bacteriochlorophyllide A dehydrogenase
MKRHSLLFIAPDKVIVQEEQLPAPGNGQVCVQTEVSAISPGTELLIYRGGVPGDMAVDETISALPGALTYPLRYGYAAVGKVIVLGPEVDSAWKDRLVFSFQPHSSHYVANVETLIPVPQELSPEQACFLPNMETAVNFIMDGRPLLGERVVVFGQGIVGLLTTSLLARFPLARLVTVDKFELRRQASLSAGASTSLDPGADELREQVYDLLKDGADLTYELSGAPAALDQAIRATGFSGRVVIGSWYGTRRVEVDLGGRFHRSRIRLISSQVSSISPELTGRWDKLRRFSVAWEMIAKTDPARWITHRFPIHRAAEAYQLLDQSPQEAIQVLFTYPQ